MTVKPVASGLSLVGLAPTAMVGASFCWATGSVLTASLVRDVSPVLLVVLQLLGSTVFLWGVIVSRCATIPHMRRMLLAGSLGVLEPGLTYLCCAAGLQGLSVSAAGLIFATEPLFVALLACGLFRERLSRQVLVGAAVSVAGVALTLTGGVSGQGRAVLLVVCSTAMAALYVVCNQRVAAVATPLVRAAYQQLFGLVVIACVMVGTGGWGAVAQLSSSTVGVILLSGIVQYALSFWLYLIAVERLPATVATLFLALIPVITALEGALFLGERLTAPQLLGASLVVGVLMIFGRSSGADGVGTKGIESDRAAVI